MHACNNYMHICRYVCEGLCSVRCLNLMCMWVIVCVCMGVRVCMCVNECVNNYVFMCVHYACICVTTGPNLYIQASARINNRTDYMSACSNEKFGQFGEFLVKFIILVFLSKIARI